MSLLNNNTDGCVTIFLYLGNATRRHINTSCLLFNAGELNSQEEMSFFQRFNRIVKSDRLEHALSTMISLFQLRFQLIKSLTVGQSPAVMHHYELYLKHKGNRAHNKPQKLQADIESSQKKCSQRQAIHLLVVRLTALCFGALSEICSSVQPGRVEVVTQLVRGEQGSRSQACQTGPDKQRPLKPGCHSVACRWAQQGLQVTEQSLNFSLIYFGYLFLLLPPLKHTVRLH